MESPEELVRRLARMANLTLTGEEIARLAEEIPALMVHMEGVSRGDAPSGEGGLPPTEGAEDIPRPSLPVETVLGLAPRVKDGYIMGPKPHGR